MLDQSISAIPKAINNSSGKLAIIWFNNAALVEKLDEMDINTNIRAAMDADHISTDRRLALNSCL
jgi:hypothetical protein